MFVFDMWCIVALVSFTLVAVCILSFWFFPQSKEQVLAVGELGELAVLGERAVALLSLLSVSLEGTYCFPAQLLQHIEVQKLSQALLLKNPEDFCVGARGFGEKRRCSSEHSPIFFAVRQPSTFLN